MGNTGTFSYAFSFSWLPESDLILVIKVCLFLTIFSLNIKHGLFDFPLRHYIRKQTDEMLQPAMLQTSSPPETVTLIVYSLVFALGCAVLCWFSILYYACFAYDTPYITETLTPMSEMFWPFRCCYTTPRRAHRH